MLAALLSMATVLSLLDPPPLDLNCATARQLESLPGIGPARAAAIVEFRTDYGPFVEMSDLLSVPGIGEGTLEALSGLVFVGDPGGCASDTLHWLPLGAVVDPCLTVAVLDVGEGDAILVTGPDGRSVLVDGGPDDGGALLPPVIARLAALGVDTLEAVFITHPHEDHIGGLVEVARRIAVRTFHDPGIDFASPVYEALLSAIGESGADYTLIQDGQVVELGISGGFTASVEVLDPGSASAPSLNERSAVFRVTFGGFSMLLAGDIEESAEMRLAPSMSPVQCMVVPHHGSSTSAFMPFLRALRPRLAVVSAGIDNMFGHPSPAVVAAYTGMGASVLRTDRDGTIFISTDGIRLSFTTGMRGGQ
jgi:competence protein ComEC